MFVLLMEQKGAVSQSMSWSLVLKAELQGVQTHPQNFWFGENPGRICGNLGKICEKVRKIVVCALL